jgi:hypothetical protein
MIHLALMHYTTAGAAGHSKTGTGLIGLKCYSAAAPDGIVKIWIQTIEMLVVTQSKGMTDSLPTKGIDVHYLRVLK